MTRTTAMLLGLAILFLAACQTRHQVDMKPVEVKPIHITIDVNIKVDRALDDFFGDIDSEAQTAPEPAPAKTQ